MRRASSGVPRSVYRRDFGVLRVPMLAGWLFADLFLVLFIVAFASQPAAPVTVSKPKVPIPTHSPTPPAMPSASPKPAPIGVESESPEHCGPGISG